MTRLLVSVRNADEAEAALAGGADLIDVKEPAAGSLGAASAITIQQVIDRVAGRRPVSAACGELHDWTAAAARDFAQLRGLSFAKIGTAGFHPNANLWETNPFADGAANCHSHSNSANATQDESIARWQSWQVALPSGVVAVRVTYADLHPPRFASVGHSPYTLVDTYDKSRGNLFAHWSTRDLATFCDAAHIAGHTVVVAGSLQLADFPEAVAAGADIVAVRTAACLGGRTGQVGADRVRALKAAIEALDARQVEARRLTPSSHLAGPFPRQTLGST
jgi:uncharacterized protein (UPF0264 family)